MAGITQKSCGALFPLCSLQKTKAKTKPNLMGILILKKACSGAIVKVFVIMTIIKSILLIIANNDNNNSNNNDNNNNKNNN